jgi:hypothetical protein
MRSPSSRTLTTLAFIGLIVASPTFNSSAMAAKIHAKPAHVSGADYYRTQHLDTGQVIAATLSQPWFIGQPPPMYVNGCRIWVDPHGHYVPSQYQYNPETGGYDLQ